MAEEKTSPTPIAKVIIWPLVALVALFLFRAQIAEMLPTMGKITLGSLTFEKESTLGKSASPQVLTALNGLPESAIFQLISRNLQVTCFEPPVEASSARADHAKLIERGMLEEISAAELRSQCKFVQNPIFGVRLTPLGESARNFQLGVLAQLSASKSKADQDSK
jgi:hypothetical protein